MILFQMGFQGGRLDRSVFTVVTLVLPLLLLKIEKQFAIDHRCNETTPKEGDIQFDDEVRAS